MARPLTSSRPASREVTLLLLSVAQFMVILDFSIVNVALPGMQHALGFTPSSLQWVISAYSLAFGGLLLLGGRAGDLFGRRRFFIAGLIIFILASLLGGLATTPLWLILARIIQGVGAALLAPTVLSLTNTIFPEGAERNKALGVLGAVASSGFAAGAILGGLLTATLGWRWVMFVNVPIGIIALAMAFRLLSHDVPTDADRDVDILGAATVTGGLLALVYAVSTGTSARWVSFQTIGLFTVAVVLLVAFILIELRVANPLVPLSIFRRRTLSGANLVALLAPAAFGVLIYIITLYLQEVQGASPLLTGLAFLPLAAVLFVGSNVASRLVLRVGYQRMLMVGLLVFAVGLLLVASALTAHVQYATHLLPALLIVGVGIGPVFATMIIAATVGIPDHEQGLASGILSTSQQVGAGIGLAIASAVIASHVGLHSTPASLTAGLQSAVIVCVGFALVGALIAFSVIRQIFPSQATTTVDPQPQPLAQRK